MLILLDIGNTAATYGIHKVPQTVPGTCQARAWHRLKFGSCSYVDIPKLVNYCLKSGANYKSFNIVISSVVPKITRNIVSLGRKNGIKTWVAGQNLPVPVKHPYPKNQKPGIDRLVCLYGAKQIDKTPLLVIDFGTAITFDYLSKRGIFEGGMIVPGPELSFQTLVQRAALIPKNLALPRKASFFLGKNTLECLSAGILEGYGAMTDGLIERFRMKYGKNLKVIATGGFAGHLKPYTRHLKNIDPQLSIKSLRLLFENQL